MEVFSIWLLLCMPLIGSRVVTCGQVHSTTFDVTKYEALGNGKKDDSKAFVAAWKAACGQAADAKVVIPKGKTYLLNPTSFEGPCKCGSITFEVLGEIIAIVDKSVYKNRNENSWLAFRHVNGLIVKGGRQGIINGKGSAWWKHATGNDNRPANHISLTKCNGAIITNLNIRAPPKSPNTDGIDISESTNLFIHHLNISTGDDCIAINGGCSNINITNVACGPGHGISIGSLGKAENRDEVEDIHIRDCSFNQTENGVRIKTVQGGSGFARRIKFAGITFNAVDNPIIIDQYYCPHKTCKNKTSAVEVSYVSYSGMRGTSIKTEAISLSCSRTIPCTHILLEDINIRYAYGNKTTRASCINAHGEARSISPELNCLAK